ncbi:hypothetical protein N657DRAFT_491857 [Parathielavia appendiculata]|uniref:Uncharacterized protein n=1 Tax=Parathielavia appendiculata TaxID=2587402 RepID=A0AAN6TWP4_9PEZI|nr:hypothetical protein N657DRAFT_491857 [Parathielavia appendiculata]
MRESEIRWGSGHLGWRLGFLGTNWFTGLVMVVGVTFFRVRLLDGDAKITRILMLIACQMLCP